MRLRYRLGYGVQSPSRYYFIRNVLHQRLPYYAYSSLPRVHGSAAKARLLFRLANHIQAQEVVIYSDSQTNKEKVHTKALQFVFYAGCHSSTVSIVSSSDVSSTSEFTEKVKRFYYIDESHWTDELSRDLILRIREAPVGTLLNIEEIYSSKDNYHRWLAFVQELKDFGLSFAAYEMNNRGLLLLDKNSFSKVFII